MTIEPIYVVDTNALIWHLTNDRKLGTRARDIFNAAELGQTRLVVSAIVMAEMFYANKKFGLFADIDLVFRRCLVTDGRAARPVPMGFVLRADPAKHEPDSG